MNQIISILLRLLELVMAVTMGIFTVVGAVFLVVMRVLLKFKQR